MPYIFFNFTLSIITSGYGILHTYAHVQTFAHTHTHMHTHVRTHTA